MRVGAPVACLVVAAALSACGGTTASRQDGRGVAQRFAAAVLRGDAAAARALLLHGDEPALVFLVRRASAPWRGQHASLRPPARGTGNRWTFRYAGRRTQPDGRFETEKGELVVFVAERRVRFFVFAHVSRRFSTHHDSQLLPSNR